MRERFAVVIVGGGPGGAATAIALARAGHRVALLERGRYDQVRIGETLPPTARVPLAQLGLWERFRADGHAPSPGTVAVWGGDEPYPNDFIFNPYGHGWHLDRRRFEAMLADVAAEYGGRVHRDARVTTCEPTSDGWRVAFAANGDVNTITSTWLVDATGRLSSVARQLNAKRVAHDRLIGAARFFIALSAAQPDTRTLVEAAPDGWWYSAWLPNAQLIVAYMTDADLLPRNRAQASAQWRELLAQTTHTRGRTNDCVPAGELRTLAADSSLAAPLCGERWLAVGDAAMAFDPLSSQGISHALESGLRAAKAIDAHTQSDPTALDAYRRWTRERFAAYLRARTMYYEREQRWPASPFWMRRQRLSNDLRDSEN